jgi:CubicO group peptidase (beta-lactamase class C family)
VTKTFTGLLLLVLRDEGKLSLDDPLTKWLPEAKGVIAPTSDSPPITLRNLVTHTSGIPRVGPIDYGDGHEVTEAEVLGALKGLHLEFAPGSRISYSNLAMGLAGIVIKRAAKQPYRDALRAKVLAPLGIHGAWAKADVQEGKLAPSPGKVEWKLGPEESAGGLYLSLDELAKYVRLQLSAWPPRDGPESKVARRSTLRESHLRAGFSAGGGEGFGVNWGVSTDDALGVVVAHTGSTADYHCSVIMLPRRGLAVISLASGSDADHLSAFTREQLRLLIAAAPKPPLVVGASARAALDRVRGLWARCDEPSMRAAMKKPMFDEIWSKGRCAMFDNARSEAGALAGGEEVLESDELSHAKVRLRAEKGQRFDLAVWADSEPPHLIDGMLLQPVKEVGPAARVALDRVKALWLKCDEASVSAALTPQFTAKLPWKGTCELFDKVRRDAGAPKSEELLDSQGPGHARVRVTTERNRALEVTVWAQSDPPNLMTGFTVKPAP